MTPVHFRYLFSPEEEFLVLHPLSPEQVHREVRTMPIFTIEQFGPAIAVRKEHKTLLFKFLRDQDFSICRKCNRGEFCATLAWDHAWLSKTKLSLVPAYVLPEKVPPLRELFDDLFARFSAKGAAVHAAESLLGLRSPYTQADVKAAFKRAALVHHPDRTGVADDVMMKRLLAAKQVLES